MASTSLRLMLAAAAATTIGADTLFAIDGDTCGESDVQHIFVGFARAANAALQVGTCAEQGYSVDAGSTSVDSPLGPIETRLFTQDGGGGDAAAGGGGKACGGAMLTSMASACAAYTSVTDPSICGTPCEAAASAMVNSGCTMGADGQTLEAQVRGAVSTCGSNYRLGPTGCSGGYTTITDLGICETAKAALEPDMGGVQDGGFGNEWANGCFFNRGSVYFHTVGDTNAHTSADGYVANGGWSDQHQALCQIAPGYRLMRGCSDGYVTITELSECEAAKAVLEPSLTGVTTKGFGQEWANGCFMNVGAVYFHTRGDQTAHDDDGSYTANGGWSDVHQALCKVDPATSGH